jgi:hypothetical protein
MFTRPIVPLFGILTMIACADGSPTEPVVAGARAWHPAAAVLAASTFAGVDVPTAILDPGSIRATNHQYLMRGVTVRFRLEASDARMTGFGTVVANGNLSIEDGSGQVWGELLIDSDQGDHWEGNWHGRRTQTGNQWTGELDYLLHGRSSANQRLLARVHETITTFTLVPSAYLGQLTGTIRALRGR